MEIKELSKLAYENAKSKGFWDKPQETGTLLMLIVTELGEALEADRKNRFANRKEFSKVEDLNGIVFKSLFEIHIKDTFEDEIADAYILLSGLVKAYDIDIEYYIKHKMRYNELREKLHGKKY